MIVVAARVDSTRAADAVPGTASRDAVRLCASVSTASAQEPSITVNTWRVADGRQEELIELLLSAFEHMSGQDGFLLGRILQGVDRTRFVSYAHLRSPADRDRAMDDRAVRTALRSAETIAHPHLHNYELLRAFEPS
jgi:heme-degrading monooxygenase HmoA